MASCVQVDSNGFLTDAGAFDPDAPCSSVLVTVAEFQAFSDLGLVFGIPSAADVQAAFMAGISLPLVLWLTAWGYGVVVNFVGSR